MTSNEYLLTSSEASQQFSICLWDYKTMNVQRYYRNGGVVHTKCLGILGQDYILTAEQGKPLLHVWPLNSQDLAKNIRLILPEPATCMDICPRSVYLAVGIQRKIYVWHMSSGKLLSLQEGSYQSITCIKFSSDGYFLLIGGNNGSLITYNFSEMIRITNNFLSQSDIGQAEPCYEKNDHSMSITDIHVGQFGRKARFATVSQDGTCFIYSLLKGELLLNLVFGDQLTSVVFDNPCLQLIVGTEHGDIKAFYLNNPPKTLSYHFDEKSGVLFRGHQKKIVCMAVNLSQTVLASGSEDNFVITWDMKSGKILKKIEHKGVITNIKFVMAFKNFSTETLKSQIILKNLERSIDSSRNFTVSKIQTEDIVLSDEETSSTSCSSNDLLRENRDLRISNMQLFQAAMKIAREYGFKNVDT
ncbi:WD repeat-containing protein 18 [Leptinotarsa decemlineata]|uniref:WD repeat-containing protein 18 n=1 Tax=Leptinotarsa decemlineata TaxID=7539 RepID=UPI003D30B3BB